MSTKRGETVCQKTKRERLHVNEEKEKDCMSVNGERKDGMSVNGEGGLYVDKERGDCMSENRERKTVCQ